MLNQLLNFIVQQKLFQSEQKILLAVSGGIDSMAMAHLFQQTDFQFAIAHCNFQLRGKDSDEDQLLVEEMANTYLSPIFLRAFETEAYAKKHGISIQMSARHLRRTWFDKLIENEGFDVIATAHHLNDSLETVLFNLAKGTGISGLKGILPKKEKYVRPMMFASREMIFNYMQANNITWREDKSNSLIKYHRNLIRHKIVPELKKINPNLEETFSQSIEKIAASERIYRRAIEQQKGMLVEKTGEGVRIEKDRLKSLEEARIILFELLKGYGFNFHQVQDMLLALDRQPGKAFYSHDYQLTVDREYLFISKIKDDSTVKASVDHNTACIDINNYRLTFTKVAADKVEFSENKNIVFLDFDKLEFPLMIRKWKHADRFQPLGMKHKKKLSDFMIDEKIPLNLKEQVLVLVSGENLIWVIGHRIDERYKITRETKIAYKIFNSCIDDKPI